MINPELNEIRDNHDPYAYNEWEPPRRRLHLVVAVAAIMVVLLGAGYVLFQYLVPSSDSDEAPRLLELAREAVAENKPEAAIIHYRNLKKIAPQNGRAMEELGRLYVQRQEYHLAEKELTQALRLGRESIEVNVMLIESLVGIGDFDTAIARIASIRSEAGRRADLAVLEAKALTAQGKLDAARAVLDSISAIRGSDQAELLIATANIDVLEGDAVGAAEKLENALALVPDHVDALIFRGDLRSNRGELIGAEADFRRALALRADDIRVLGSLVDVLLRQGRIDEAKPFVAKLREKSGRSVLTLFLHGQVAYLEGAFDIAEPALLKVIDVVPHPQALWALAGIYEHQKKPAQAEEMLIRLNEAMPNHLPSLKRLARVQLAANAPARAVVALSTYPEAAAADAEFWLLLSDARRAAGNVSGAREALEVARTIDPNITTERRAADIQQLLNQGR
ncbi:MAG: tetratricopeptide repeat protein, partial [Gammaproteobacteria bacterium]